MHGAERGDPPKLVRWVGRVKIECVRRRRGSLPHQRHRSAIYQPYTDFSGSVPISSSSRRPRSNLGGTEQTCLLSLVCGKSKTGAGCIWTVVRRASTAMLETVLGIRGVMPHDLSWIPGKRLANSCAGSVSYQLGCACHQTFVGMKPFDDKLRIVCYFGLGCCPEALYLLSETTTEYYGV